MATVKISELTPLNSASVTAGDLLHIINIEETTENYPTGTNKRITAQNLANGLAGLATVIPQTIQTALDNKVSLENFNNASLKIAAPVAAATTTDIDLASTLNTVLIDGVQLLVNDRVLVKNQNDNRFNGIYVVNSGVPTRATDFDTLTEINNGYVLVNGGDTQKGSAWAVTSTIAVVNTDPIVFTQFAAAVTNINKASIGLGQVNDTSDLNKPLSTATTAALALKQGTITGAASTITTNYLAIDRALISNDTGTVAVSAITSTELGRLTGVSSNIQNQLNAKAPINNPTFTGTVNLPSGTKIDGTSVDLIPAGAIMAFAMNSAPSGWLACNGSTINRVTYARLFDAISTLYGAGNGTSTFRLPDLRGYFVRGYGEDEGSGAFGAKQADAFKAHTHNTIQTIDQGGGFDAGAGRPRYGGSATASSSTGGSETRPKNIAMLYCIKI